MENVVVFTNCDNKRFVGKLLEETETGYWVKWGKTVFDSIDWANGKGHYFKHGEKTDEPHKSWVRKVDVTLEKEVTLYDLGKQYLEDFNEGTKRIDLDDTMIIWSKNGDRVVLENKGNQEIYLTFLNGTPVHRFRFAVWGKDVSQQSGGGKWLLEMDEAGYKSWVAEVQRKKA